MLALASCTSGGWRGNCRIKIALRRPSLMPLTPWCASSSSVPLTGEVLEAQQAPDACG